MGESASKASAQVRSQMQFGNEVNGAELSKVSPEFPKHRRVRIDPHRPSQRSIRHLSLPALTA